MNFPIECSKFCDFEPIKWSIDGPSTRTKWNKHKIENMQWANFSALHTKCAVDRFHFGSTQFELNWMNSSCSECLWCSLNRASTNACPPPPFGVPCLYNKTYIFPVKNIKIRWQKNKWTVNNKYIYISIGVGVLAVCPLLQFSAFKNIFKLRQPSRWFTTLSMPI